MKTVIQLPRIHEDYSYQELKKKIYLLEKKVEELSHKNQILTVKTSEGIHFIKYEEIRYVKADSNYSMIYLLDGRKILASKTLKFIQSKLSSRTFIRVHQSYLVNLHFIENCRLGAKKMINLKEGKEIPVSRKYFESMMEAYSY